MAADAVEVLATLTKHPNEKSFGLKVKLTPEGTKVTGCTMAPAPLAAARSEQLRPGDIIVAVNGKETASLGFHEVVRLMTACSTTLVLRLRRLNKRLVLAGIPDRASAQTMLPGTALPTNATDLLPASAAAGIVYASQHDHYRGVFQVTYPGDTGGKSLFSVKLEYNGYLYDYLSLGVFDKPELAAQFYDARLMQLAGASRFDESNFITSKSLANYAVRAIRNGTDVFPLPVGKVSSDGVVSTPRPRRSRNLSARARAAAADTPADPAPAAGPSLTADQLWVKGDTTRLHRERVRKHIFCVQYLTRGLDPPAQHLPGYSRAAQASSKKDNGWFKPVPQKKMYGKPAQKFRKRKKKKRDWQMDTTSDDTDEEAYYSAKPKAAAGVAVRRSSRSANRKQKSYKYDIDSDELLEDGETKKDKEEKQAGSGGEEDVEMAPADVEVDAVFAARFTDVAIENNFNRDFDSLEYLVKWKELSYLHLEWISASLARSNNAPWTKSKVKKFLNTDKAQQILDADEQAERKYQQERAALEKAGKDPDTASREYKDNAAFVDPKVFRIDRILATKMGDFTPDADAAVASSKTAGESKTAGKSTKPRAKTAGESKASGADNTHSAKANGSAGGQGAGAGAGAGASGENGAANDGVAPVVVQRRMYLVKWLPFSYLDSTWEWEPDVTDEDKVAQFMRFTTVPSLRSLHPAALGDVRPAVHQWAKYADSPEYNDGRKLRDYQLEGLNWLVFNWYQRRNCILADEMGLGKTIQTLAFYNHLYKHEHIRGPYLVVAPLSTLENWKREFETWTDMNVVVYHDSRGASAREFIREHEFNFTARHTQKNIHKFHVLITTYQILLSDFEHLAPIRWRAITIDEAHNLRNRQTQILQCVNSLSFDTMLLLTGTPVHNNIEELWTLLNVLDRNRFSSLATFLESYGSFERGEQVAQLQKDLRPLLLRRVKEDVEKSIPAKEETIVHVELTTLQKKYYRAIFERNRNFLSRGGKRSVAQLSNVEMELRKCCNHPFLINGLAEREVPKSGLDYDELMVRCAGKLALLDKLLPKLKAEGHKVLIFSQFNIMLDIMSNFCGYRGYNYERIDGSVASTARQPAIDRFNDPDGDSFIFLLTTKAGGVGINLTGADTVIIYDSDWNPQNDLQAIARCHRIGQTQMVRIYRLITKKTYEAEMFRRAGRKLGLSQAVFETGGMVATFADNNAEDDTDGNLSSLVKLDVDKIEMLLKFGAYALLDDDTDSTSDAFYNNDIDSILKASSTQVQYQEAQDKANGAGSKAQDSKPASDASEGKEGAGNGPGAGGGAGDGASAAPVSFSKATFAASSADASLDLKDPAFWEKVLGPKPADRLWKAVRTRSIMKESDEVVCQFVEDVEKLIVEALDDRKKGIIHPDTDTINNIIIELQVRGGQRNVPATIDERMPKPRSTLKDIAGLWLKALNSKRRRRNAKEGAHPFLVTFRDPEDANKPTKRRRAPAKRGVVAENSAPKKRARRPAKAKAQAPKANGTATRKPRKTRTKAPPNATFAVKPHNADFCYVCREPEGFADNPIVFCEGCNLAVHQFCYGIVDIPDGDDPWYCSPCSKNVKKPECVLCPFTGGAFKPTTEGRWVHAICAFWAPTCEFLDTDTMEPVEGCVEAETCDQRGTCSMCGHEGIVWTCAEEGCTTQFHAICGRRSALVMFMNEEHKLVAYCSAHRAPRDVPLGLVEPDA